MGALQAKQHEMGKDSNNTHFIESYLVKGSYTLRRHTISAPHMPVSASPAGVAASTLILNAGSTPFSVCKRSKREHKNITKENTNETERSTSTLEKNDAFKNISSHIMPKNALKELKFYNNYESNEQESNFENVHEKLEFDVNRRSVTFKLPKRRHSYCVKSKPKQEKPLPITAPSVVFNENESNNVLDTNGNYDASELKCNKYTAANSEAQQSYLSAKEHAIKMKTVMAELLERNIIADEESLEDLWATEILSSDYLVGLKDQCNPSDEMMDEIFQEIQNMNNPYDIRKDYYYL